MLIKKSILSNLRIFSDLQVLCGWQIIRNTYGLIVNQCSINLFVITMLIFSVFQCLPSEEEPRSTLGILSGHLHISPTMLHFQMCHFMCTHSKYTKGIGQYILGHKKQSFEEYINCMGKGVPLDEIALVIVGCMFHFHICILSETKFWMTNRDHKIGMCSLLLGLVGPMEFTVLKYCTKWSSEKRTTKCLQRT